MSFNSILNQDAIALVPEETTKEIFQSVVRTSVALAHGRKLADMTSDRMSISVLDMLPAAYWSNNNDGLIQTSKLKWEKKYIQAEELAVIVPVHQSIVDDADYDVWAEVQPRLTEAFGKKIDDAIVFGVDKPSTWRSSIIDTAVACGNYVTADESSDIFTDVFSESGIISLVEKDGFLPTGIMASVGMRGKLRSLRDSNGRPIYLESINTGDNGAAYMVDGLPIHFLANGAWNESKATMVVGDMTQLAYSIRQEISYTILKEANLYNTDGELVYNLAQQGMVALRAVMRLGWEIPNSVNPMNTDNATRCPFAVYKPMS